jgi:diadenosine tetraphosphatase ApaH/serine/threonine PP2A family protein phosphatase
VNFDVIGDIHGQYDKLVALLLHLGYSDSAGVYRHPARTAIFVGDLIDRGPKQFETLRLVRRMVEAGWAQCIMGNHEFNAIAWATPDPKRPARFLRDHDKPGNRQQHEVFLQEIVEDSALHAGVIKWFRTLPLWLDLGGLRVVHACWHEESMEVLRPLLGPNNTLTDEAILRGSSKDDPVYAAIEVTCKGPEAPLPEGVSFQDKEGKVRHEVRVRWWLPNVRNFREAAIVPPGNEKMIPDVALPAEWKGHRYSGPPVLFGHYWFTGSPHVISPRFACLDYSVARGGPLVAYRWDGEKELSNEKIAWV